MTTTLELLQALKARLDTTSSDPKWLNDAVDAIIESTGAEPAPAPEPGEAPDALDFADLAGLAAWQALLTGWRGGTVLASGTANAEEVAKCKAELSRMASVAMYGATSLEHFRQKRKALPITTGNDGSQDGGDAAGSTSDAATETDNDDHQGDGPGHDDHAPGAG